MVMIRQRNRRCTSSRFHLIFIGVLLFVFNNNSHIGGYGWMINRNNRQSSPQQQQTYRIINLYTSSSSRKPVLLYLSNTNNANNNNNNDIEEAIRLKEKAEQLRNEIKEFERQKEQEQNAVFVEKQKQQILKQEIRERYSAIVPILKPDGTIVNERCDFNPKFINVSSSYILTTEAPLPLGLILGESIEYPGTVVVDDVVPDSNGDKAGIRIGDIIRACTACRIEMITPTWQLLAGGIGQPKTVRYMYSVDNRPFEEVLNAMSSNRFDPSGRNVFLVLERRNNNDSV